MEEGPETVKGNDRTVARHKLLSLSALRGLKEGYSNGDGKAEPAAFAVYLRGRGEDEGEG